MSSFDNLPQRNSTHDTAEAAETAFHAAIESCNLFVVQQKDRNDYGTDVQIEVRDGESMTNIRVHIQLEGTKSVKNANEHTAVGCLT